MNTKKLFLLLFITFCVSTFSFAQVMSNYSFTTGTGASLIDISTGYTQVINSANDDTPSGLFDIGFPYVFMGNSYTQVSVSPDGFLKFGSPAAAAQFSNDLVSTTNVPKIVPYWDDLATGLDGYVRYKTIGLAPNRQLVIEWFVTVPRNISGAATAKFQAVLNEGTRVIQFISGGIPVTTGSYSIGMTSSATQFASVTVSSGTVSYVTANNVMTDVIPLGTYYSFTPPAVVNAPTAMSFTGVSTTGMTVNWLDNSTNENGYRIYRSLDGVTYNLVNTALPDVVSYSATGLLPGTTYYWQVTAFNEGSISTALSGNQATNAGGSVVSTGSGSWSSTTPDAPWPGGVVPVATDNVTIAVGHTVTIDAAGAVCNNLTVSGALDYGATLGGLLVNGSVTVSIGGSFTAGASALTTHTLGIGSATGTEVISGGLINNGTFDMNTTAGVTTTFWGISAETISGTGSVPDFYAIVLNKGTNQSAVLDVTVPITINSPIATGSRLTITNGTLKISSASTLTPWFGSQTICAANGRLWLNNASAVMTAVGVGTATGAGSPTVTGELRIDNGTFGYGSGNNTLTFSSSTGILNMNGGILNIYGAVAFSSSAGTQFNMTGGNIYVDPQAANALATGTALFSIGTSATVNWSGGVVTIVDPHSAAGGTAYTNAAGGVKTITGGKLRIGDGTSTTTGGATTTSTSGFGLTGSAGVWDLEIDNRTDASTSRTARLAGSLLVLNNVEIKANSYLWLGSSTTTTSILTVVGNAINNGTLAGTFPAGTTYQGSLYFRGLGPQSLSGNGNYVNVMNLNFYNLGTSFDRSDIVYNEDQERLNELAASSGEVREMYPVFTRSEGRVADNPSVVSLLNTQPLVVNRVNAFSGTLNPGANFVIGRAGVSIPIIQVGGGTVADPGGIFAVLPTVDNSFGYSTFIYSTALGGHTTGAYNEMPAGPQTITQFLINDAEGLTLNRAFVVTSFMTFTLGHYYTTNTNSLTYLSTAALVPGAASWVYGPFIREIPDTTLAGLTFNYPVGKGSLRTFSLVDPVTLTEPVRIRAEVFDANAGGTPGIDFLSLNTNRYWSASITSGAPGFTSTRVRVLDDTMSNTMGLGKSGTLTGVYNLVSSAVPVVNTITSDVLTDLGFFVIGQRDISVLDPTGVSAVVINYGQIDLAFTPNAANNNVVIVWNNTGTFSAPVGAPVVGNPLAGGTVASIGTTSPFNHTGLNPVTTYYYKLFSYDGAEYSLGVTASGTTPCGPISSFPWTEGFESVVIPAYPACWFEQNGDWVTTNNANSTNDADAHTGTQFLRDSWSATNEYMWTPGFAMTAGTSYDFSFWWAGDNFAGWTGDIFVNSAQDSTGATQLGASFVTNAITTTKIYEKVTRAFVPSITGTYYFAIRVNCPTSTPWYLSFDDFTFLPTPTVPVFSINPASKNFGLVFVDSSSAYQKFTVTNIGVGTLTITTGNISIIGIDAGQYALADSNSYPINLTAGQTASVYVKFAPTSIGTKLASLQISDNLAEAVHTMPLSGIGVTHPALPDFEDFETFIVGQRVACQDPSNWTTWDILPCDTAQDAIISSTYAFSGTKSVKIVSNNDLVRQLDAQTTGKWYISFMTYIPAGKSGYFNSLGLFAGGSSDWGMECYFDVGGGGRLFAGAAAATAFTWVPNLWKKVEVTVDLGQDSAKMWYDGTLIKTWQWTLGSNGSGCVLQFDGNDFYGAAVTDEMYFDDYRIEPASTTFPLTVIVANGWNMVSIPGLLPTNQNVTTWWPGKDPTAGVFKFAGGYQAVTVASPGIGYWMKNVGAQTYNTGDEWPAGINFVAHDPIPAALGWNLFGGYEQSVPTTGLTTTPPGLITGSVYKYSGGYIAATTIDPGYGYWIKLTGAGSINIPSALAGPTKVVAGTSTEGFGKIIITDNTQNSYTLYASKGKADLTQFDLPPYPPQGMFDVRYSSQRFAENLSTQQSIEMTGVQYPVKVKADGVGIILSDETGKEIARLKTGEEITLNTSVSKLMVTENVIPAVYALEQNYPNPFNPSTTIQFSIPEDVQNVKLIIYSALGEKVAELVNTGLQAGIYKYSWNANNVASGLYIYQIVTEKFVSTKKMMLLK